MIYSLNKLTLWLARAVVLLVMANACSAAPVKVSFGYSHPLREWFNVHESPVPWVSVAGKKYPYVMGDEPFYVKLPDRESILFITTNQTETTVVYHFVSLKNGEDIAIKAHDTYLYSGIGSSDSTRGHLISFEAIDGPKIVIVNRWRDRWWRYSFDLEKLTVVDTSG